eukprot:CAMPEP_0113459020 /NCGR_PEP_ID=MMETSP0014_2-20120614/10229_1 /TAXON_ID=2857 /ORGANISM="Nitzschia sp." /LENGTH=290 /DNA_ID=CAMNT_0000350575 /DNA_START=132 /DNA_END=1004 /DNA_ORIENTATION=- /assembly_acc=CAM_ASM_000159
MSSQHHRRRCLPPVVINVVVVTLLLLLLVVSMEGSRTVIRPVSSFSLKISPTGQCRRRRSRTSSKLQMALYTPGGGRSSSSSRRGSGNNSDRSKRQYRVGQLVQTELARILHTGLIKGDVVGYLESDLRQRISIVSVDVSPDLRQARVSVSIRGSPSPSPSSSSSSSFSTMDDDGDDDDIDSDVYGTSTSNTNEGDDVIDKRRAYSWLVENTKPIRHTLAQRLNHMKSSAPTLQFVLVDVSAAVDVMYLIDKVSKGYEREDILTDFDYDDDDDNYEDDDEWEETDESFFE